MEWTCREEGTFSGALRGGKRGKVELAHGGTLFLDELGDMPAEIQTGLLRFLEEGKVIPLGSECPRRVDVRVITAMNVDPGQAMARGKLRLDLYHRLNVFPIFLPPLRERAEDLPLLIRHLLDREGFSSTEISPDAMNVLVTLMARRLLGILDPLLWSSAPHTPAHRSGPGWSALCCPSYQSETTTGSRQGSSPALLKQGASTWGETREGALKHINEVIHMIVRFQFGMPDLVSQFAIQKAGSTSFSLDREIASALH